IISNKPIYFTKGSLYKAMRASIAIPSLIVPVRYDNTILVDGGVLNPIPIEPLPNRDKLDVFVINLYADEEGKKLIVKEKIENTITQNRRNRRYNAFINRIENFISRANVKNILDYITSSATSADNIGYIQLLNSSAIAMIERIADLTIKAYPPDVIIDIPKDICKALDFGNIKELIEYGETKTLETLKNIKAK
ncbi:MAG TPA: patatin-like phospholipase family protein, partial [Bacteroidales bacterium]|nr:patatin-like phospholipase family protein [Bacteroidales bacterium]